MINPTKQTKQVKKSNELNPTLKGVLLNNFIKNSQTPNLSFDEIQDSLLICEDQKYSPSPSLKKDEKASFDIKKAMKPLLIGTGVVLAGCFGISAVLKKSSQRLLETKSFEQLPDLAINMNIQEEPQFAIYRAIRDPNYRNILGATGVFLMSGITIACKNFVDGAKEIWLKKRGADIERDLQENLIEVEKNSFSGKLQTVNEMLKNNMKYFENVINPKQTNKTNGLPDVFNVFFKGMPKKQPEENTCNKNKNKSDLKYLLAIGGIIAGGLLLGKLSIDNIKKTAKLSDEFANKYADRTIEAIKEMADKGNKEDIPTMIELLKSICAKPDFVKDAVKKYNLPEDEIKSIIGKVEETKKTIFSDAPVALGGIPKKIQYYCYINEDRGHLYNWILNPQNKFTKYIFLAFTATSATGYLFKQGMNAAKEATVMNENAKTELNLRKKLVDVEIANFKAKKESAVNPLIDNFTKQANENKKSKEELKGLADNILAEIKNGPPYVYT